MFQSGEYVVYGFSGICQIKKTMELCMPGSDHAGTYYAMVPLQNDDSIVYTPVDSKKSMIRRIMTAEEAKRLITLIPDIEPFDIENDKYREEKYKEVMKTCDPKEWIRIIKTLWMRNKIRSRAGKPSTSMDTRYLKAAKDYLYTELSVALDKDMETIENFITDCLDTAK